MGLFSRKSEEPRAGDLSWEAVQERLRPRLVGRQIEAVRALALPQQVRESAQIVFEPVSGDVGVGVVIDSDEGLVQVGEGLLASWGRSLAEVVEVAVTASFGRDVEMQQVRPGLFIVSDPWFAAAVAYRPSLVEGFALTGAPVGVFADAGYLLVTGQDDDEGLALLGEVLDDIVERHEKPVSVTPLTVTEGAWTVWTLPEAVSESDGWRLARRRWDTQRAEEQREPLAAELAASGRDVHVAPVELVRGPDGKVITYSSVTQGVPTAVVRTDKILRVTDDGDVQNADFDAVVAGEPVIEGTDPQRWLITV